MKQLELCHAHTRAEARAAMARGVRLLDLP
jgi:hypothetical protein